MDNKVYVADDATEIELKNQAAPDQDEKEEQQKQGCCGGFFDEEEKKPENEGPKVKFFELWKFATKTEIFYLIIGAIAAIIHGVMMPLLFLFFGELIDGFVDGAKATACFEPGNNGFSNVTICLQDAGVDTSQTLSQRNGYVIYWMAGLGGVALLCGTIHAGLFSIVAHKQEQRIKLLYFKAIIRQEMAYYQCW